MVPPLRIIPYQGRLWSLPELSRASGIIIQTLRYRIHRLGWDAERAITTPLRETKTPPGRPAAFKQRPCSRCSQLMKPSYIGNLCEACRTNVCEWCGKSFIRRRGNRPNRFCVRSCQAEWQKTLTGELAGNWRGGIHKANQVKRANERKKLTKDWREAVLARDNYTCQRCGFVGSRGRMSRIHAHHIKPFKKFPALRCDVNNGITLCGPCHVDAHRGPAKQFRLFRHNRGGRYTLGPRFTKS